MGDKDKDKKGVSATKTINTIQRSDLTHETSDIVGFIENVFIPIVRASHQLLKAEKIKEEVNAIINKLLKK